MKFQLYLFRSLACVTGLSLSQMANAQIPDICPQEIAMDIVGFGTGPDILDFTDDMIIAHGYGFINGILYAKALGAEDECREFYFDCLDEMRPQEMVQLVRRYLPSANNRAYTVTAGAAMFETFRLICNSR